MNKQYAKAVATKVIKEAIDKLDDEGEDVTEGEITLKFSLLDDLLVCEAFFTPK